MSNELFDTLYSEEIFLIKPKPIVVISSAWEELGDKERELLTKIISALKISIDSITITSQKTLDVTYFTGTTNKLIFFGETPAGVARYEVLESANLSFICSESLTQLIDNESARKQLWQGLRALFSI